MSIAVPSRTAMYNAVYAECGSQLRVNSHAENNAAANRITALWDDIIGTLIEDHPWNFLIGHQTLNATGDIDVTGTDWSYAAQLPPNCMRWLPPAPSDTDYFKGVRQGDYLLIDRAPPVVCRFIRNDVDVGKWSRHFVRAAVLHLAAAAAEGLTQSQSIKDRLLKRGEAALRRAKRTDALESGNLSRGNVTVDSSWLRARNAPHSQVGR